MVALALPAPGRVAEGREKVAPHRYGLRMVYVWYTLERRVMS
jgi:hypothetical protein